MTAALDRIKATWGSLSDRQVVLWSAVLAFLLRYPGLIWPLRPDEAGFTLVARYWDPQPDSLYGDYWVDRPPELIALLRLSDWIGGAEFIRLVAAIGCAWLVVSAAQTARLVAGPPAARAAAVLCAAVAGTPLIDVIAAKGEILALPLVLTGFWFSLAALREAEETGRGTPRALALTFGAGLLAMLALGLKQNLATGLVFGGVVLLLAALRGRISWSRFWQLGIAALGGAAIPVVATVVWCLVAGVHLETLWYAVYGFRGDAYEVIRSGSQEAPAFRALILALVAVATGILPILGVWVWSVRRSWSLDPVLTGATAAVLLIDGVGLVLGGSYWRPYLYGLVPAALLALALVVRTGGARLAHWLVALSLVSTLVASAGWVVKNRVAEPPVAVYIGQAIREVAEPGDTMVVYGGRSDLLYEAGMTSPYEHLWSLPMRTLDHDLSELRGILQGPDAPTWFVEWVPLRDWGGLGETLRPVLEKRYRLVADDVCDPGRSIYVLVGEHRAAPQVDCDRKLY